MHPTQQNASQSPTDTHGLTTRSSGNHELARLEEWFENPFAEFEGKKVDDETKQFIRDLTRAHITIHEKK